MLVELREAKKYFFRSSDGNGSSGSVKAVDGVSLRVGNGVNIALVGESGSGKTTVARLLLRLYDVDRGGVFFNGQDITFASRARLKSFRQNVQIVFQDPFASLDPRWRVRDIVQEGLWLFPLPLSREDARRRVAETLRAVGLPTQALDRFPHEFSGGERQRIAIARALVMDPQILILDEAVSSLDVLVQQQILELLVGLQKQRDMNFLLITHNLRAARFVCDRIAVMYRGQIVEMADTAEIFRNPIHPYTRRLLSASVDYAVPRGGDAIELGEKMSFHDKGNGHFVLE